MALYWPPPPLSNLFFQALFNLHSIVEIKHILSQNAEKLIHLK